MCFHAVRKKMTGRHSMQGQEEKGKDPLSDIIEKMEDHGCESAE